MNNSLNENINKTTLKSKSIMLFSLIFLILFKYNIPVIRIRQILSPWIQIHKDMRIHGTGSKEWNIKQKLQKKNFCTP